MGYIKRIYGDNAMLAFVITAILDYLELVGDTKMSPSVIKRVAEEITSGVSGMNLNVADIKLCFSKLLQKEQYGAVNGGKIIQAFSDYWNLRCNEANDLGWKEHLSNTSEVGRSHENALVANYIPKQWKR